MARIKIGAVIEIHSAKGLTYAQYTHHHKRLGALIRVFNNLFETRPASFNVLVHEEPQFLCFFPLGAAVHRKIVAIAGHAEVPQKARNFPLFRDGVADLTTGKVRNWWLWDGEREWPVGQLTAEQRKLSLREVLNDTMLIDRIESGWTPETDSE